MTWEGRSNKNKQFVGPSQKRRWMSGWMDGCFLFSPPPRPPSLSLLFLPPSSFSSSISSFSSFSPPLLPSSLSHPPITDINFLLNHILNY
ncbi:uncharacterized protein BO72DRAFT_312067 [Aspergillus fijiensis CBS 313.89]|uniref:Uncharacterized protein n=1 Tax=Aspergillus fijiensis CBS 313.89 TaxID=1448319 RepID=A0A8G1REX0_9EURO|nr:uncharacterized protein BO72DRAFT_312067 [Aspergillus fijiensis CBS 313.89]RAK71624.1 hypothetical protein BO72DRAFT_312067 [Aspergillus fijiensis CBS 313.89]